MFKRTFTLDEANRLLPVLEALLRRAMAGNRTMQEAREQFQQITHRITLAGGLLLKVADVQASKRRHEDGALQLRDAMAEIDAIGVLVKDLEIGLLDFPCQVGDEEIVLLCWKLDEPVIAFWHSLEAGFKGRRPIDSRIAQAGQSS
jgi:hypothetical protein